MKKSGRMLLTLVIPLSLIFIALMSLLPYTTHSEKYYKRLTGELLLAAANEQKDLFSVKLDGEVSLLNIISATLNVRELMQSDQLLEILSAATRASDFRNIIVTETSGRGIADDGQVLDLQGRTYLQQALRGERAMEYIAKTRLVDDEAAIALAVPVYSDGRIIGAVVGVLEENALRAMFRENAYREGETLVCNQAGDIIVNADQLMQLESHDNLFSILRTPQTANMDGANQIITDIQAGAQGFSKIDTMNGSWYIAYIPSGYNGWMIVRTIPASVVNQTIAQEKAPGYVVFGITIISAIVAAILIVSLFNSAIRKSRRERERLLAMEEEYRIAAKQSGVVIIRINTESGAMISSQGAIEHFQLPNTTPDVPFCHALEELVEDESRETLDRFRQNMFLGKPSGRAEICMRNLLGASRWFEFEFTTIGDGGGNSTQAIITIRDITTQQERIAAYRRWQSMLADSVGVSAALMAINVSNGVCERAEGEFAPYKRETDISLLAEYILARYCEQHVLPEDRAVFGAFVSSQRLLGVYQRGIQAEQTELHLLNPDGTSRLCTLEVQLAYEPRTDEIKAFLTLRDFEDITREVDRLNDLAMRDGLSGLLNRTAARSAIEEALHNGLGDMVALFMIDADNFKQINDLLGHQHGDLALRQMSDIIRGTFRAGDIIARIGGDEFFAFLSEVPAERFAEEKAAALCRSLQLNYPLEGHGSITLTASVGVYVAKRGTCDYDGLYAEVDKALYEAKNAGKNRYNIRYADGAETAKSSPAVQANTILQMNELMKHLDGGVILLEIGERITPLFISDGYFMHKGIMRESIAGGTFPESVVHPHDFPQLEAALRVCAAEGTAFQMSYRNVLSGGGYGWRHINAVRVPSIKGDCPTILSVISDITELHDAAEHLESLAESSVVGVFIMRMGERLEINFFNDGALSITGFSYEQMRLFSRDASAFFRGGNLERFRMEVTAAMAENRMVDYLYQSGGFLGKEAHMVHLYGVKLDVQNGIPSYLIILLEQQKVLD